MDVYEVLIELEIVSKHRVNIHANDQESAVEVALEAVRVGVQLDPMKYIKTRKVELEAVSCVQVDDC